MSITLDLSYETVDQLKRLSAATGQTIEEIVARGIETQLSQLITAAPESEGYGLSRLMGYAGCIDSGVSNSGDNRKIDEDLADAYAGHSMAE